MLRHLLLVSPVSSHISTWCLNVCQKLQLRSYHSGLYLCLCQILSIAHDRLHNVFMAPLVVYKRSSRRSYLTYCYDRRFVFMNWTEILYFIIVSIENYISFPNLKNSGNDHTNNDELTPFSENTHHKTTVICLLSDCVWNLRSYSEALTYYTAGFT